MLSFYDHIVGQQKVDKWVRITCNFSLKKNNSVNIMVKPFTMRLYFTYCFVICYFEWEELKFHFITSVKHVNEKYERVIGCLFSWKKKSS